MGLVLALASGANADTIQFEGAPAGPVPFGSTYDELGMRVTSFSANSIIGDPLGLGFGGNWYYFHGLNQYIEFRMIDGSTFDLSSFDLGTNGFTHPWILTSSQAAPVALPNLIHGGHHSVHVDFVGAEYQNLSWFRVGSLGNATQVDNVVFTAQSSSPIPEPSALALLLVGTLGGVAIRLGRRRERSM
ncbi:MAG: PEP-CTERM sorting domain-containing protein [Planctomycetota bacterium]|jgi:hypothetical protein